MAFRGLTRKATHLKEKLSAGIVLHSNTFNLLRLLTCGIPDLSHNLTLKNQWTLHPGLLKLLIVNNEVH